METLLEQTKPQAPSVPKLATGQSLEFCRTKNRKLRVNIMSETSLFGLTEQGGHTAFVDCVDLMKEHPDLEVKVNSKEPCDVLHSHSWGPFYFYYGLKYRGRRIFTSHVVPETAIGTFPMMSGALGKIGRPLATGYLKSVLNFSNAVIAVAPKAAQSLQQLNVRPPIHTILNPIRANRFFRSSEMRAQGRAKLGITDDRPVVIGVGQIQPRKGISDFAAIASATPEAQFIWVGGRPFGLMSAGISEMNDIMNNPPANLKFVGTLSLPEMPLAYNASDLMLFPSFQENCPYAPMEAAACGLPVIFRDLQEYSALYPSKYLRASNVQGFTHLVHNLISNPSLRQEWAEASLQLASYFKPAHFIQVLASLYDQIACGNLALEENRLLGVNADKSV